MSGAGDPVTGTRWRQTRRMSECSAVAVIAARPAIRVSASLVCLLALSACVAAAPTPQEDPRLVERSRVSMGTEVHVSAWTADEAAALAAFERVFDEFDRLDALMSVWKEGSDILRIN